MAAGLLYLRSKMCQTLIAMLLFVLLSFEAEAASSDSVTVRFVIYDREGSSYAHSKVYVIDNDKGVAYYYTGEHSAVRMTIPKSAYKNPNATLVIVHPYNKQKDASFKLRNASLNISYSKDGEPVEHEGMCGIYLLEVKNPLIDPFNPSNRTFTSEEIEKMPR